MSDFHHLFATMKKTNQKNGKKVGEGRGKEEKEDETNSINNNNNNIYNNKNTQSFPALLCCRTGRAVTAQPSYIWGRYHGDRRPSSDNSFHSPTVIPPSALDKPSITKRCHRRRTCSHTSPRRSPTMVTLHDTRFVECRWRNDGWTVKTVVT